MTLRTFSRYENSSFRDMQPLGSRSFRSGLLGYAVTLVLAASERVKPNTQRLPEFTDQSLVHVQPESSAPVPISKEIEELDLASFFLIFGGSWVPMIRLSGRCWATSRLRNWRTGS